MDDLGLPPCQQTPESEDWILLQCKQPGEGCALAEECRSAEIIWNRCGKIGSWPLNIGFEWIWFINYSWCDDCIPSGIRSKERRCDLINNVWFLSKKWQHIQQIWTAIDPDGNPTSEPPHFGVFCGLPTNWYSHVGIPSISMKCGAYWSPTSWFLGLCLRGCRWGDGYTGLGQLFRCPVVSCGRGDGRQYQESVDFWWELSFKSWRPPIFRHKKLPSHLEPIWCRLYPFRETVTWFRRFDPIPQASRTREQRKCQCNSQTGWLGMGMWWLGDLSFYWNLRNPDLISLSKNES